MAMNGQLGWLVMVLFFASVHPAQAQKATKMPPGVKIQWEDTSDNENGFRIYRITPKGKTKIAEVGSNVTTYTDNSPASKACYVVTAFNSAGESDPSKVSCLDSTSIAKGRLCEVELSPRGLKLLAEVEQTFNKQVRDQWYKDMDLNTAALIATDGTPTIRCHPSRRNLNEETIVHELGHLRLRARGFPTIEFDGIERDVSRWIHETLYDTIEHWIIYPQLRELGYSPDAAIKNDVERTILENRLTDKPLPPTDIILRYLRLALESSDAALIDRFGQWYVRQGWDAHLKKARGLVQFIKNTNPTTAEQSVQSLIEVANVLFEPYLTFQVERWKAEKSGSILHRKVVIRALPQSRK